RHRPMPGCLAVCRVALLQRSDWYRAHCKATQVGQPCSRPRTNFFSPPGKLVGRVPPASGARLLHGLHFAPKTATNHGAGSINWEYAKIPEVRMITKRVPGEP